MKPIPPEGVRIGWKRLRRHQDFNQNPGRGEAQLESSEEPRRGEAQLESRKEESNVGAGRGEAQLESRKEGSSVRSGRGEAQLESKLGKEGSHKTVELAEATDDGSQKTQEQEALDQASGVIIIAIKRLQSRNLKRKSSTEAQNTLQHESGLNNKASTEAINKRNLVETQPEACPESQAWKEEFHAKLKRLWSVDQSSEEFKVLLQSFWGEATQLCESAAGLMEEMKREAVRPELQRQLRTKSEEMKMLKDLLTLNKLDSESKQQELLCSNSKYEIEVEHLKKMLKFKEDILQIMLQSNKQGELNLN